MEVNSLLIVKRILFINTAASLLYMIIAAIKIKDMYVLFKGLAMIFCPVFAPFIFFFSFIFKKILKDEKLDYDNLCIDKSRKEYMQDVDKEMEMEVLPFEEVLTVSGTKDRRRAVLNMLKTDMQENIGLIRKAVENDDTETSHYAATVLAEVTSRFQLQLGELQVKYDMDRSDKNTNIEFIEAVMRILNSGAMIGIEKMKYDYMFINLLLNLDNYYPEEITEEYYAMMVRLLCSVSRMKEAEEWALRSLERMPDSEQSYLNVMYIRYTLGKEEEFMDTLDKLRKSNINLSHKGLDIVRFWISG